MAVDSSPGEGYGKMRVLQLPSNTTIPGPQQVQNNFESDPLVSSQLSLLRAGGSDVELGNLLSLPFNGGLLYIEPVYIRANTAGLPAAAQDPRRVRVERGDGEHPRRGTGQGVRHESRRRSPSRCRTTNVPSGEGEGQPTPSPTPTEPTTGNPETDLAIALTSAQSAYDDGQLALAKGDFAAYGEAMDRLKAALDAAAAAQAQMNADLVPTPRRARLGGAAADAPRA